MKKLLLLAFIFLGGNVFGQKGNAWIGGDNGEIKFQADSAISSIRPDSQFFWRTSASICDTEGNLLFYTNGFRVFNRYGQIMQNGDSLNIGDYLKLGYNTLFTTDGAIILPVPGNDSLYYLFHLDADWIKDLYGNDLFPAHIFYSVVNMKLDHGNGGIVSGTKDRILLTDTLTSFGMQAVKHGDGYDWWLLCHEYGSNRYYEFLIDSNGIHGPSLLSGGIKYDLLNASVLSLMKFSSDGNYFVQLSFDSNRVDVYNFDRCQGVFYNHKYFLVNSADSNGQLSGVSISKNDRFIYVSSNYNEILQFDLDDSDIAATRKVIGTDNGTLDPYTADYFAHEMGADGKIYITSYDQCYALHVVNSPDSEGLACHFVQWGFPLMPGSDWFSGVPNEPNYNLGPVYGNECDTVIASSASVNRNTFFYNIYPNPTTNEVNISFPFSNNIISIYDLFGREMKQLKVANGNLKLIDLSFLQQGVYVVVIKDEKGNVIAEEKLFRE